ncbi:flagellar biosynthesis protein FlhB [Sphingomonas sp. ac-8]|uniref:flagellar biosynthesis protein FlhB n=1 Tax=Sphingomonas sp. ac-8 TaxID=3242977 RepID=UPI003A7F851A
MSEDKDQKTHDPTDKKLSDARKKGDVAHAPEMRHAAIFAAALIVTGALGVWTVGRMGHLLLRLWGRADDFTLSAEGAQSLATGTMAQLFAVLAPLLGTLVAFALLGGLLQGRPTISWSRVSPKWSKLSPLSGAQRLFGKRALVEFAKTLAKVSAVVAVSLMVLWPKAVALDQFVGADPMVIGSAALDLIVMLLKSVAVLVGAIALSDLVYQRRSWLSKMRMSLQEIKDEHKQSEGDPKIKAKIRMIGMQRSRKRMMAAVPTASVIVTNPTHFAVALKYDHGKMGAPVVVAKGVDAVALRIREVATGANVPIVENRPLARALYAAVEIDHPVPAEHYAAVAEVIGYVMRLARRLG